VGELNTPLPALPQTQHGAGMVKGGHHTADTYEMAGSHAASVDTALGFSSHNGVQIGG
jgi:hypothetical protein